MKYTKTVAHAAWALDELTLEMEKGNPDTFHSVKQKPTLGKKNVYCAHCYIHPCAEAGKGAWETPVQQAEGWARSSNQGWSWPKPLGSSEGHRFLGISNLLPGFRRAVPTALTSQTLVTAPQRSPSTSLPSPNAP